MCSLKNKTQKCVDCNSVVTDGIVRQKHTVLTYFRIEDSVTIDRRIKHSGLVEL